MMAEIIELSTGKTTPPTPPPFDYSKVPPGIVAWLKAEYPGEEFRLVQGKNGPEVGCIRTDVLTPMITKIVNDYEQNRRKA
jgi:hypothetical protein